MYKRELTKKIRVIGKNQEFLGENGAPLSLGNASEFLTKEFIYDLRKRAVSCNRPVELLWYIVERIEQQGKILRGRSEDEDHSLVLMTVCIFCYTFGVSILDIKFSIGVFGFSYLIEHEESTNNELLSLLDLYRDEWEALIKEYENEKKNND